MTASPPTTDPRRALLAGAIDYAGLYPPAGLDMGSAVSNYLAYRDSADAWALGRFLVPVSRLAELARVIGDASGASAPPVSLGARLGPNTMDDVETIERFNRESSAHGALVESVEAKAGTAGEVRAVLADIPKHWTRYVEVPLTESSEATLDAVAAGTAFAKIRTGGTTADAFPGPADLVRFLSLAASRRLAFKATAGLHHPLRGCYRLTYAADAPSGVMHGYLNLMLAAAVIWTGRDAALAHAALVETEAGAVRLEHGVVAWRDVRLETATFAKMRANFFHGFGSCSFREPIDEIEAWEVR